MKTQPERFDFEAPPVRTKWYLRPLTWLLCMPDVLKHGSIVKRHRMEGVKPPFVILCNHNAFLDFKVLTKSIYPARANYVVAIDGFIGREKLLRDVGCIGKRKFTSDLLLIRNLMKVIQNGDVAVIYPEARYSLCGTTAVLPESLGKFCKLLKAPVVTLICHGHHMNSPFWNLKDRGVKPVEADLTLLYTAEELKNATPDEINDRILEAFQYDDYAWLREKGLKIRYKGRAEGLEKVLYQCPACRKEYEMHSEGAKLWCASCGKEWEVTESMELSAPYGRTEFPHIPDWYEWERENVRAEVRAGTYSSGVLPARVMSLPNAKKFIPLGEGTLLHDMNGFTVRGTDFDGDPFEMIKTVPSLYSCHIEYEYLGKYGDLVDLNTLEDTWYITPHDVKCSVTKMALATEELYFDYRRRAGKPVKPGFA